MMRTKRWIFLSFVLIAAMLLPLFGCASGSGSLIRYNISQGVDNLDPQFAEDPNELLIILNCFEGLFRLDEEGVPVPAAAESYTLSEDERTYTFSLYRDLTWSDETPLTAHDFVFAFQRLLQPDSPAPCASDFLCIRNAEKVLEGTLPPSALGVKAQDDHTLIIRLEEPNLFFTELLTSAAAMPCREDFFYGCNGRYGLSLDTLLFNGPYKVRSWNNNKYIGLTANETYHLQDALPACSVYLYTTQPAEINAEMLLTDRIDSGPVRFEDLKTLENASYTMDSFRNTVYLLFFNLRNPYLQNEDVRLGMAYAFNRQLFQPQLSENLELTNVLIPPIASIQGENYRSLTSVSGLVYDKEDAQRHFADGLEQLGILKLSKNNLICLENGPHKVLAGYIQQQWQNDLNLYVNTEALSSAEFYSAVSSGDFQMAIVPLTMSQSNPGIFLSQISRYLTLFAPQVIEPDPNAEKAEELTDAFLRASAIAEDLKLLQNYCTYAQSATTREEAAMWFAQAEKLLLESGYAVPLYFESSYYATSPAFSGIRFTPYAGHIYFRDTVEK